MNITFHDRDGAVVATPHVRRLDAIAASDFRRLMIERCGGRSLVVLCFDEIQFIDSSGLSAVVGVLKCLGAGGALRLAGVNENLRRLLRLTRLHDVFGVYDSVDAAVGVAAAPSAA